MKNILKRKLAIALIFVFGCADLDVENPNNPDFARAVSSPDDLVGVVAGAYASVQRIFYGYQGHPNFEWAADHITMTNNVSHWWQIYKVEPRPQLPNSLTYVQLANLTVPWGQLNSAVSSANDVIRAIEINGIQVGPNGADNPMMLAAAYYIRGIAAGYIANTFAEGYVIEADTDVSTISLRPYSEVIEFAVSSLDKAIALCEANSFVLNNTFMPTSGGSYDNVRLGKLANTYAGYLLMSNARTAAENAATDWNKVLAYANKGMTEDFILNCDGNQWQNWLQYLSGLFWYWRVDHRIIRHFDPEYPKRYPLGAADDPGPADASNGTYGTDARFAEYYFYETNMSFFNLSRGPQLRSHYRWNRYPEMWATNGASGPIRQMFAYQNDLMKAEALVRTGSIPAAVAILNAGPRVTDGGLPALSTAISANEALDVIFAERDIELTYTDYNLHHKDMRRRDMLQIGTLTMHPVPATELSLLGLELYTFGGVSAAGQPGSASGANSWLND